MSGQSVSIWPKNGNQLRLEFEDGVMCCDLVRVRQILFNSGQQRLQVHESGSVA